jgi:hypothetical protein
LGKIKMSLDYIRGFEYIYGINDLVRAT